MQRTAARLARLGDLSWMLDEHQDVMIYQEYRAWEARMHEHEGDGFFNCWMLDAGRQVGKTFTASLIRVEDAIRWANTRYISACAEENSLAEFIIPNIDAITEFLPDDIRPTFLRNHRGMKAGYWFPNKSVIKLVGLDKNPKGLRGPKCDGCNIHEAAFPRNLAKVVVGVVQPQFQRGRDPTLLLESSAPEDVEHDFDKVFKPSCERRKAYVFMTIHDNTALSLRKKNAILSAAREVDKDAAAREYEGVRSRDKILTTFPEAAPHMLLSSYELPKYGIAMRTLDPGQVHLFAVNWSVYDVTRGQVVFVDDWAESNPNTERVAAIMAAREHDLFGTVPNPMLSRIPLIDEYDASGKLRATGWRTLLRDDRCEHLADRLHTLAQRATGTESSAFQWYDNEGKQWQNNPHVGIADVNLQLINDLSTIYGMHCNPTTKDDLEDTMVLHARQEMSRGRVAFAPRAELTFKHVQACMWDKKRTKFTEHKTYGHYDLAADVIYALRNWPAYMNYLPEPPTHLGRKGDDWVGNDMHDVQNTNELGAFF
jgi:hypothetical protein